MVCIVGISGKLGQYMTEHVTEDQRARQARADVGLASRHAGPRRGASCEGREAVAPTP